MSSVKTIVRVIISLMCFMAFVEGQQTLSRRQQLFVQRRQQQVDQQQDQLEKQLMSQAIISPSTDQTLLPPINHAILDSIFNVPIQAIKAVNELVRTLAAVRARVNGQQTANLVEDIQ